jgi:hypothetical protein
VLGDVCSYAYVPPSCCVSFASRCLFSSFSEKSKQPSVRLIRARVLYLYAGWEMKMYKQRSIHGVSQMDDIKRYAGELSERLFGLRCQLSSEADWVMPDILSVFSWLPVCSSVRKESQSFLLLPPPTPGRASFLYVNLRLCSRSFPARYYLRPLCNPRKCARPILTTPELHGPITGHVLDAKGLILSYLVFRAVGSTYLPQASLITETASWPWCRGCLEMPAL